MEQKQSYRNPLFVISYLQPTVGDMNGFLSLNSSKFAENRAKTANFDEFRLTKPFISPTVGDLCR